jgi:hypothetical protein
VKGLGFKVQTSGFGGIIRILGFGVYELVL